jgi:isopenicillin N synthase-like dioxygenase
MPSAAPKSSSFYLPSVDITPFLEDPTSNAAKQVIEDVRAACISTGFFQMTGHGVSETLQKDVFDAAAKFFSLPLDVKTDLNAAKNIGFRGYDLMGTQLYEDDVLPDLKEGFFIGQNMPPNDPRVQARRFFMGSNVYPPTEMLSHDEFKEPVEKYYQAMAELCHKVLDLVAATLPYGPNVFDEIRSNDPACPMRLLHYPPTRPAATAKEGEAQKRQLGSSAHTDFGAVTLLLQDEHPGLEVQDRETGEWIEVPPNPAAYVVNMGDIVTRLTGGLYKSSIHRVVNKNPTDRFSIVYFFDGNVDFKLHRLDKVYGEGFEGEKAPTVEEHMIERTMASYNMSKKK